MGYLNRKLRKENLIIVLKLIAPLNQLCFWESSPIKPNNNNPDSVLDDNNV